jgi:hypothetical protein
MGRGKRISLFCWVLLIGLVPPILLGPIDWASPRSGLGLAQSIGSSILLSILLLSILVFAVIFAVCVIRLMPHFNILKDKPLDILVMTKIFHNKQIRMKSNIQKASNMITLQFLIITHLHPFQYANHSRKYTGKQRMDSY